MKLSLMAMGTDRLGRQFGKELEWEMVSEVKMSDGGAARTEDSGFIIRIPAIAGIGRVCPN